jgi:hypothetical protein
VEQYEAGYCEVCEAVFTLPISEGRASEASRDAQTVAYIEVEMG